MTIDRSLPLAGAFRRLESPYERRRRVRRLRSSRHAVDDVVDGGVPVVVFVVATDRQLRSASAVANALGTRASGFFLDRSGRLVREASAVEYVAAVPRLMRNLDDSRDLLGRIIQARLPIGLVVSHDYGLREQALVSMANNDLRSTSLLLPDGLLSFSPDGGHVASRHRRLGYRLAHRALGTGGVPGRLGSSHPEYLLGWGEAWLDRLRPLGGHAVVAGNPRFQPSAHPPPVCNGARLLVCNPTESRLGGGDVLWRRFVSSVGVGDERVEVRIRHRPDSPQFDGTPYEHDLNWSTHVAAVRSTVLVEASATGRPVVALESSYWSDWMGTYVGLTDDRLARFDLDADEHLAADVIAAAERTPPSFGRDYLADRTPEQIAEIILECVDRIDVERKR